MKEAIVILINRALPYNCQGKLTGWSGVEYGQSTYEEAFGAHVCRMPLSQWRACNGDVARGMVRRACQWEVDIELPTAPAVAEDVTVPGRGDEQRGDDAAGDVGNTQQASGVTLDSSMTASGARDGDTSEIATGCKDGVSPTATGHTAESLAQITNYRVLLKIAREAGVEDPEQYDTTAKVREAIMAKQGALQTA